MVGALSPDFYGSSADLEQTAKEYRLSHHFQWDACSGEVIDREKKKLITWFVMTYCKK